MNDAIIELINENKALKREVEQLLVQDRAITGIYPDTYFDDLQYQMVGQRLTSPSSGIVYSTYYNYVNFKKTADYPDDYLVMAIQMSHRWKIGTVVYPHIHWLQSAAAMPNFLINYNWEVQGAAESNSYTLQPHTANVYTYSSGSLNQITKFGSITPPAGAGLSDILFIYIFRDVANDSGEFAGAEVDVDVQDNAFASSFDIHFEIDQAGSDTEYVK